MYDAAVIGGGPGGYTCAIRAAQLGEKVCLIEKSGLGGTCTQQGCIPTKYLHSLGEIIRRTNLAKRSGINATVQINYSLMKSKMFATVSRLASGINRLLESNGVEVIRGEACIQSENRINVDNGTCVETRNIVIATGSVPVCLPGYRFGDHILSTTSVLELDQLPESITIIGGGYSGCEFASILNALGCKVCLIEAQDHLLPLQISEVGDMVERFMTLDGIRIMTKSSVDKITGTTVFVNQQGIKAEKILICTGRRPNVRPEELSRLALSFNSSGIIVNEKMQTNIPSIYAIGDVTGIFELAHVAAKQGEIAAENIGGVIGARFDYNTVPVCIFTYPEVAIVGDLGTSGKSGEYPLVASAKANCLGDTRGTIKVFEKEGKLVGCYIVASHAGEIIGEAALAIKMNLTAKDIYDTMLPHPTLPESFQEAVRDINKESIHLPSKRRPFNPSLR
jgi:dihydrolipoamide dehydrogenase